SRVTLRKRRVLDPQIPALAAAGPRRVGRSIQPAMVGGDFLPALRARVFRRGFCQVDRTVAAAGTAEGDGDVAARGRMHARQPGVEEAVDMLQVLDDLRLC